MGESKSFWMDNGWKTRPVPDESLFDLVFDPNEAANLASEPAAQPALDDLRERLRRWMEETADPLLAGGIPKPPGAIVNDPDGISPKEKPL